MQWTDYERFIHVSRYARWRNEDSRRETYDETVSRYLEFMQQTLKEQNDFVLTGTLLKELEEAILDRQVMPSMRAMMTAGPALARNHISQYNCAYLPIVDPESFRELFYILMNGTGVGYSVERQYVNKLPEIPDELYDSDIVFTVDDSKEGWCGSFLALLRHLYKGEIPSWDTSQVRPAGSVLKTFGGRASGPEPLEDLFHFTVRLFKNAKGRKLNSIECHDLCCKIAEIVVVGGVRRSAMISLSNLSDLRMRDAKSGQWWEKNSQRRLANNSVAHTERPEIGLFMEEWRALYESKSGERGIFNRVAARNQAAAFNRRSPDEDYGLNPCGEIILRPFGFCNLSEAVIRAGDSAEDVSRKVHLAAVLGTFQSCLTDFKGIRPEWKKNAEEERLLGVSLTGIMDNKFFSGQQVVGPSLEQALQKLRTVARKANHSLSWKLGIPKSAAITTGKPSGTVSQLVNSASGMHTRYSQYLIRTVRQDQKDPLTQFLIDAGIPNEPCVSSPNSTQVFSFPIKSPQGCLTRHDLSAIQHLEIWKRYKENYCEHNPSVTIYVDENEWMDVGAWTWRNFDNLTGISFLPKEDENHSYRQAPYQEISAEEYNSWVTAKMPAKIDWSKLREYESEDYTTAAKEVACSAGGCEI